MVKINEPRMRDGAHFITRSLTFAAKNVGFESQVMKNVVDKIFEVILKKPTQDSITRIEFAADSVAIVFHIPQSVEDMDRHIDDVRNRFGAAITNAAAQTNREIVEGSHNAVDDACLNYGLGQEQAILDVLPLLRQIKDVITIPNKLINDPESFKQEVLAFVALGEEFEARRNKRFDGFDVEARKNFTTSECAGQLLVDMVNERVPFASPTRRKW